MLYHWRSDKSHLQCGPVLRPWASSLILTCFILVLPHSSCESWTAEGFNAVLAAIYCRRALTRTEHAVLSQQKTLWNLFFPIQSVVWCLSGKSLYWCKALSALCCCSISPDCLFSEECTHAGQLGVGTLLIKSEQSVCWWRTDGSCLNSVVMAVWMIILCSCFSWQTEIQNCQSPTSFSNWRVHSCLVSSFSHQKYVLHHKLAH